ncbi:UDP-N-acetylmuramoylalanine--D-glutamate ligase [Methanobrevibacter gottschalkii]|uniref:UDP-N-acetylmuramoylalanine--D-glutamate ligase n=2 Tax=Methanobrevibacter gottschalkii TaxID=190974 RepID=A0A3N5B3N4_9EURY|nr:Mur ligase family protein [Methanobrevibacter gottschalkii]MCQ2970264.1 UDP-N-acetylmuramoylalanine--D-glutamate ligase [archaeon]OEC98736.1 UDP-N-acetylmuramoylalanine--D-glutamate ligase [Methanobrevibacter sp. A27]RPF51923.1 UDP-N-acetylmuramoylalanine--D-glutamate ligase [Methanobrevibacter gottschalkii DSM 11977]SEL30426.1 UDP-N-acetylmuramoylalanine--D-glutamate ligase [Methanobrevibacter gottschalkii]
MKAAVIGLGVEGKKAVNSLLNHGWEVYATDLNINVDLSGLNLPNLSLDVIDETQTVSIVGDGITLDLGFTNPYDIDQCDAVAISPSMFGGEFATKLLKNSNLLSDVVDKHKDIFTIGITGTNGKTTTVHMLKEILENAGKNVLVGGNGGGGFSGYYDLILEANEGEYDILLVEVCDMTLDFCKYCFDFDMIGLTNIGNDHMNVHKTIANYKNSLVRFFEGKTVFTAFNQDFNTDFKESSDKNIPYFEYQDELKLFGKFNLLNAGLATAIARELKIPKDVIKSTLSEFNAVEGRLDVYKINNVSVYVGKTDNSDALTSILSEKDFYAIFIGTPRHNEIHRLDILDAAVRYNPEVIVLFPGLDDTLDMAVYRLNSLGYMGNIITVNSLDEIIELVAEYSHEDAILIGGNGQDTLINIQERIKLISENL